MRGSRFVVLRMCCSPLSYFAAIASPSNCGGGFSYVQHVRGGERREHSPRSPCKGDEGDRSSSRWWAVRNRPTKFLSVQQARESRTRVLTRRHVLLAKGVLQRLRRWFALLLDITTLKHIRQLRQARQGSWQHGGPIPVQYRPILTQLRAEIAGKSGLERRARRVNHELNTICLGRYLEAAYWSLAHDGKRVSDHIEETITWREKVGAHRLRKGDVMTHGANGAILVKGHDLQRRPVVYFRLAHDGRMEGDGSATVMIFTLERAIRLMPRGTWQYTIVIDCQGMGLSHMPPLTYLKTMFKLLGSHYPMRLGNVLFTNVGPSVMMCWRLVSPLLQQRTKDKMVFIPSTKLSRTSKYIHSNQLLAFAGGQASWCMDPSSYFSNDAASL